MIVYADDMLAGSWRANLADSNNRPVGTTMPRRRTEGDGDLCLLLDYDGTLVPITSSPHRATPDDDLLDLLDTLAQRRGFHVEIVSGRAHRDLESWLGHLPIALWGEHGFWHRSRPGDHWTKASSVPHGWMESVAPILTEVAASTPGSFVEQKTASIAWHYRLAEPELSMRQAHALRTRLNTELCDESFNLLEGNAVIEVRLRGVSKALVGAWVATNVSPETTIVAIGDDQTDEELFRALPTSSMTVVVGKQPSIATCRVGDYREVRRILRSLLDDVDR
jgi:trehalose 6-phosphate synthase/phosphatase